MATETIPIPRERARRGLPIDLEVSDLAAWPAVTLRVRFDYNSQMDRWVWGVTHPGFGERIPRSVAQLEWRYSIWPYMLCVFKTPDGEADAITPATLGDPVKLCVYPGPDGGHFLPEAGIDAEEEAALLNRGDAWRYPF